MSTKRRYPRYDLQVLHLGPIPSQMPDYVILTACPRCAPRECRVHSWGVGSVSYAHDHMLLQPCRPLAFCEMCQNCHTAIFASFDAEPGDCRSFGAWLLKFFSMDVSPHAREVIWKALAQNYFGHLPTDGAENPRIEDQ